MGKLELQDAGRIGLDGANHHPDTLRGWNRDKEMNVILVGIHLFEKDVGMVLVKYPVFRQALWTCPQTG